MLAIIKHSGPASWPLKRSYQQAGNQGVQRHCFLFPPIAITQVEHPIHLFIPKTEPEKFEAGNPTGMQTDI